MAASPESGTGTTRAPSPARRLVLTVALAVVVFGLGTMFGVAVGRDDAREPPRTATPDSATSATGAELPEPAGLERTLRTYLRALVERDWPRAHALMCADLAEEITAGGLKGELTSSEKRAGRLTGFTVVAPPAATGRAAVVRYTLEFARGTLAITADLEREGPTWRVCTFTNGGGTGAFEG